MKYMSWRVKEEKLEEKIMLKAETTEVETRNPEAALWVVGPAWRWSRHSEKQGRESRIGLTTQGQVLQYVWNTIGRYCDFMHEIKMAQVAFWIDSFVGFAKDGLKNGQHRKQNQGLNG